jgi:hypothetical protein
MRRLTGHLRARRAVIVGKLLTISVPQICHLAGGHRRER